MNNMMEQFEKFIQENPAPAPTEAPAKEEFVDNVIYVDFVKRCRIAA